jgi:tetratricopeptide (TPR) repeat protein
LQISILPTCPNPPRKHPQNREIEKKIRALETDLSATKAMGKNTLAIKDALWRLYRDHFDLVPAERLLRECIEEKKDTYGNISLEVAELYGNLAELLFDKYQLNDALIARLTSIETQKKIGVEDVDLVKEWLSCGEIKKAMKDPTAHREFEHVLKILEKNNMTNEAYGSVLFYLGEQDFGEKKYKEANEKFKKAIHFCHTPTMKMDLLLQLGNSYMYTGEMEEAEKIYKDALHTMKSSTNFDTAKIAETLYTLGVFYATNASYLLAEEFTLEAMRLFEMNPEKYFMIARCYMTLGTIYKDSKPNKAIEMFKKSIEVADKYFGKSNSDVAFTYCSLGEVYDKLGNHVEAFQFYQTALETVRKIPEEKTSHVEATVLMNMGVHFTKLQDYDEADKYLTESYNGFDDCLGDNDFSKETAMIAYYLGLNCLNLRRWFDAILYLEEARDTYMALDGDLKRSTECVGLIKICSKNYYDTKMEQARVATDAKTKRKIEQEVITYTEKTDKNNLMKESLIATRTKYADLKPIF